MAFITTTDVRRRLAEATLSAEETAQATDLCDQATAVICASLGQEDETWFATLSATKQDLVKGITIDLVCRAMASPQGLTRATETLGAHTRSEDYRRDLSSALLLTPGERAVLATAAGAATSGSVRVPSLPHDVYVTEPT